MKNSPKYARTFNTIMPEKTWDVWKANELKTIACYLGDHMADRVEQALEWAQRIANGETWKDVCNYPDTANWFRMIKWKNGFFRLVGGSNKVDNYSPATDIGCYDCHLDDLIDNTVPLVVSYK